MKRISQQLRNKNPEKYQFHYQSMKSLLGDETHQKYSTSLLSPKSSTHLLEDKISNNFTEPQRDPRALQYNPCTEYWTHSKSFLLAFLLFFIFIFSLFKSI